jgi:serine O-acetyltransferase
MFDNLRRDAARYEDLGRWFRHPGFWIGAVYRLGNWASSFRNPLLRLPLRMLYRLARIAQRAMFSVDIWAGPRGARIGPGLGLIHPMGIRIGAVEIGEDCLIFNDVTLGSGTAPGLPKIGNGVDIYVGARILGGVTIGDRSMIGANCVVMRDIPEGSIVLPPKNEIIPRALSAIANRDARVKSAEGS